MSFPQRGLLALPDELLQAISTYLETASLTRLIQSCRRLPSVLYPVLYADITLSVPEHANTLLHTLLQNKWLGRHTRCLTFRYPEEICADADAASLLGHLDNLETLDISSGQSTERVDDDDILAPDQLELMRLLQASADGHRLFQLKRCSFAYSHAADPWDVEEKVALLTFPSLDSLTFHRMYAVDDNHRNLFAETQPSKSIKSSLSELHLVKCQIEPVALGEILKFCYSLTALTFEYRRLNRNFDSESLKARNGMAYFHAIERHASSLEYLRVQGVWTMEDAPSKPHFEHFSRLRKLATTLPFLCLAGEDEVKRNWNGLLPSSLQEMVLGPHFEEDWRGIGLHVRTRSLYPPST